MGESGPSRVSEPSTLRARLARFAPLRAAVLALRRATGRAGDQHPAPRASAWTRDELAIMARERDRAAMFAEYERLWPAPPAPAVLHGTPGNDATPLIICLWNRPGQIDELLTRIDGQQGRDGEPAPRIRLVLWNNCRDDQARYEERITAFEPTGAIESIELVASPANIRGVARFIAARSLRDAGARGSFLMLDDDELIGPHVLADLIRAGAPRTIAGFWSWRASADDYWQRERAGDGEPANYVATGGCVCDLDVVADDAFFAELPELGLFIEDAWMSRYALARGWTLRGADVDIEFVLHETNQFEPIVWDKLLFWRSLGERYPLPPQAPEGDTA